MTNLKTSRQLNSSMISWRNMEELRRPIVSLREATLAPPHNAHHIETRGVVGVAAEEFLRPLPGTHLLRHPLSDRLGPRHQGMFPLLPLRPPLGAPPLHHHPPLVVEGAGHLLHPQQGPRVGLLHRHPAHLMVEETFSPASVKEFS